MDSTTIAKIAQWAGGTLAAGEASDAVTTICTDSRALKAGDFFVALRGENFDAHTFIAEAARRGAAGAIVEEFPGDLPPGPRRGIFGQAGLTPRDVERLRTEEPSMDRSPTLSS